jgi:hypothetical protein
MLSWFVCSDPIWIAFEFLPAVAAVVGGMLIAASLLGRSGRDCLCRRCGHTLPSIDAKTCTECGLDATRPANVVVGRRRIRPVVLGLGLASAALAFLPLPPLSLRPAAVRLLLAQRLAPADLLDPVLASDPVAVAAQGERLTDREFVEAMAATVLDRLKTATIAPSNDPLILLLKNLDSATVAPAGRPLESTWWRRFAEIFASRLADGTLLPSVAWSAVRDVSPWVTRSFGGPSADGDDVFAPLMAQDAFVLEGLRIDAPARLSSATTDLIVTASWSSLGSPPRFDLVEFAAARWAVDDGGTTPEWKDLVPARDNGFGRASGSRSWMIPQSGPILVEVEGRLARDEDSGPPIPFRRTLRVERVSEDAVKAILVRDDNAKSRIERLLSSLSVRAGGRAPVPSFGAIRPEPPTQPISYGGTLIIEQAEERWTLGTVRIATTGASGSSLNSSASGFDPLAPFTMIIEPDPTSQRRSATDDYLFLDLVAVLHFAKADAPPERIEWREPTAAEPKE